MGRRRDTGRVLIVLAVLLLGILLTVVLFRSDLLSPSPTGPDALQRTEARDLLDALRRSR